MNPLHCYHPNETIIGTVWIDNVEYVVYKCTHCKSLRRAQTDED